MANRHPAKAVLIMRHNWTAQEGEEFWTGYENFLDRIGTIGDDERTICMEVLA